MREALLAASPSLMIRLPAFELWEAKRSPAFPIWCRPVRPIGIRAVGPDQRPHWRMANPAADRTYAKRAKRLRPNKSRKRPNERSTRSTDDQAMYVPGCRISPTMQPLLPGCKTWARWASSLASTSSRLALTLASLPRRSRPSQRFRSATKGRGYLTGRVESKLPWIIRPSTRLWLPGRRNDPGSDRGAGTQPATG